ISTRSLPSARPRLVASRRRRPPTNRPLWASLLAPGPRGLYRGEGGARGRAPPPPGDTPALPFRGAAPDAVLDPVVQRVLQARFLHRTIGADPSRHLNP